MQVNSARKNGLPRNVKMLQEERKYRVKPLDNSTVHTIFTKQNIQVRFTSAYKLCSKMSVSYIFNF